ncbi:hypothetical protein CHS0354_040935 [Potamilus streckersoni]|uniref:Uncharacterized protein n=1 Tax=Potamilus streckersoni TaxID=2493646 RepID=A0AAE0SLH9_9BIVA|nr:hypothetical protein CHS0354_040935 [Potamilus streckersoni]
MDLNYKEKLEYVGDHPPPGTSPGSASRLDAFTFSAVTRGDAFIASTSEEDARQAMMLNMGYIGDGQIFLSLSGTAEMRRRIEEVNIHSSASSTQSAPAQQAVLAPQSQQLPLQQDPILGYGIQIQLSEPSEPFSVQDPKDR